MLILIVSGAFFAGTLLTPQIASADHNDALFFDSFDNLINTMIAFDTILTTVVNALIVQINDLPLPDSVDSSHIVDGTILFTDISQNGCAANQIMKWDGISSWVCADAAAGPPGADGADGADGSDGISPLTSIRVTTTEPEFLLPTDETVIGVAPTSHIFLPLGIPDGKIIVIKNAGCGCILSAQEDDEILNGDIILGFTDAVVLQYLNGIWFEIAEYAGLPAPP